MKNVEEESEETPTKPSPPLIFIISSIKSATGFGFFKGIIRRANPQEEISSSDPNSTYPSGSGTVEGAFAPEIVVVQPMGANKTRPTTALKSKYHLKIWHTLKVEVTCFIPQPSQLAL
jgi:hypothetical protein